MMFVDHYRERKTGPCFPVAVVGCRVHGAGATRCIRRATTRMGGSRMRRTARRGRCWWTPRAGSRSGRRRCSRRRWMPEREERWPSEQQWWQRLEVPGRRTQGRRLELAGRLTGVHPQLAEEVRERIATRLGVATMVLRSPAPAPGAGGGARGGRRCCMPLPAAPRCWTAWRQLGRSATCGGRRARDGWRAGRRPAPVGCWRRPVVPPPCVTSHENLEWIVTVKRSTCGYRISVTASLACSAVTTAACSAAAAMRAPRAMLFARRSAPPED